MPEHRRIALQYCSTRAAAKARYVVTISEFSKRQIVSTLRIPETRVKTIYYGLGWDAGDKESSVDTSTDGSWLCSRAAFQHPYIVAFTGDCYVQKNVPRLLEAYERIVRTHSVDLVLIGRVSPLVQDMIAATKGNIICAGVILKAPSSYVFTNATLCVVPSLYEGFGLPVVEAQRAGIPLACSTAACLPEVAGNGASYFDPTSIDGMAQSIVRCLDDPDLRAQMVLQGKENCCRFSWQKAARETLDLYHKVAEDGLVHVAG
jgi:glycosyltransferase involved in cell wall biosynthesis